MVFWQAQCPCSRPANSGTAIAEGNAKIKKCKSIVNERLRRLWQLVYRSSVIFRRSPTGGLARLSPSVELTRPRPVVSRRAHLFAGRASTPRRLRSACSQGPDLTPTRYHGRCPLGPPSIQISNSLLCGRSAQYSCGQAGQRASDSTHG